MTDEPREMRDLLIRIDEKVKNGFDNINSKLDAMDRRADGLDTRLRAVEVKMLTFETTAKTGASMADWGWRLLGPAVSAGCVFLATLYFGGKDDERDRSYTHSPPAISARQNPSD